MSLRRFAVVASFAASGLAAPALLAQVVREKVSVEVITIRLSARDRSGKSVDDLTIADLSLTVDGKPVAIETLNRPQLLAVPEEPESESSTAPAASPARRIRTLVLADEGETLSGDRQVVYDELDRFLQTDGPSARREVMVARFGGGRLEIACPWTGETDRAVSALRSLRRNPAASPLPTASGLAGSGTPAIWIQTYQEHLHQALLEAIASFPDEPSERQLLVVSGGTALMRPNDLISILRCQISEAERTRLRLQETDVGAAHAREIERATFALWSRAVNPSGDFLTMSDVVAKALERDVAIIPVAAEAIGRGMDLGFEHRSSAKFLDVVPTTTAGDGRLSPRTGVVQKMMEIAADTGSEPILVPGKAGARLSEIEDRPVYTLTFRDPAGNHRYHPVEIVSKRRGVTVEYRHGYRIPTDEERMLDTVVARLLHPGAGVDPLSATASISAGSGARTTRLFVRIEPPRETAAPAERAVEFVGVGEDAQGQRTEPVWWSGTARAVDGESEVYSVAAELGVPAGDFRWSLAVRDQETGLTSYLLLPATH